MPYSIQKLNHTDTAFAEKLIRLWNEDDDRANRAIPAGEYLESWLAKESFHAYVALEEDQVIGGLTAYELPMFGKQETEMFLYEMGVSDQHRRKGIARALVDALKQTCVEKDIQVIFVGTSMDNKAAQQLYANTGGVVEICPWFEYNL